MSLLRAPHPTTLALAALCVGLALTILIEILSPPFASAESERIGRIGAAESIERRDWVMPPLSDFAVVTARPLFSPDRRPPRGTAAPSAELSAASRPSVTLGGVVSAPGRKLALMEGRNGVVVLLSEGDAIDGWRLDEIHGEHVVLRTGDAAYRVMLRDVPGRSPDGAATAGPAAASDTGSGVMTQRYFFPAIPYHQPPLAAGPEIEPPADDAVKVVAEQSR